MSTEITEPLSPTTGEPVSTTSRRDRLGVWLIIASCTTGTVSLLIAYSYLWSLNVNNAWAPTEGSANWAADWPFWAIAGGMVIGTLLIWRGYGALKKGNVGAMKSMALISTLILLACFIGQIFQIATFPFGPQDGAYASATLWLALANCIWLSLAFFFTQALFNRARRGRLTPDNPSHAQLVAMFLTYLCVAALLSAVFTLVMKDSPNTNSPTFGTFQQ